VPGHELAGIIEETGKSVKRWKCGDRVTLVGKTIPLGDVPRELMKMSGFGGLGITIIDRF